MSQKRLFSASEWSVIEYMMKEPDHIVNASIKELANFAYTSSSTIVRLFKKLDCNSFSEFKIQFYSTVKQQDNKLSVDANIPFSKEDSLSNIAKNLETLCTDALTETATMYKEYAYQKAVKKLNAAESIDIYCLGANQHYAKDFQLNMMRIHKHVIVWNEPLSMKLNAAKSNRNRVALFISYSGESEQLIECAQLLRQYGTYIICITSIGKNSLSDLCHLSLSIVSKEKMFSKIGLFSSKYSILMVLDTLYSGVYKEDYDTNQKLTEAEIMFLSKTPHKKT